MQLVNMYTEDKQPSDHQFFLCEHKALQDLCLGLTEACPCLGHAAYKSPCTIKWMQKAVEEVRDREDYGSSGGIHVPSALCTLGCVDVNVHVCTF